ncbi:helix-turn-helix transcriptional regulator [Actinomadura macrotermitis]|uniref:HTH luxR-type domain-containing protein n=1 Tax=Actinomadura macrotermitis TaxID=2585200 RepID=A0A7K0BYH2_9ACTN|nr:LuxR family transcriptional regulator [Actinomadura macrotermitis]MQY05912.1 hypothetical protein [Actinomadura macrotermitis]
MSDYAALERRDLEALLDLQFACAGAGSVRALREAAVEVLARRFGYRTATFFTGATFAGIFTDARPVVNGLRKWTLPAYQEEFHRLDPFAALARQGPPPGPVSLDVLPGALRDDRYLRTFLFRSGFHAKIVIPVPGRRLAGGIGLLAEEPGAFGPRDLARARLVGRLLAPLLDARVGAREPDLLDALTARQRETARLAGQGFTNEEIAAALHITRDTVKKHLSRVYAVTGTNRVGLARLV